MVNKISQVQILFFKVKVIPTFTFNYRAFFLRTFYSVRHSSVALKATHKNPHATLNIKKQRKCKLGTTLNMNISCINCDLDFLC